MGCFGKTQELNEEVGRRTRELLVHLLDACKKKVEDLEEMLKERRQPWWRRIFFREAVESAENRSDRQLLRKEIGNFRKEIRKLRKELEGLQPEQLEEMRNIQGKVTDLEKRQHEVYEDIDRTSKGRPLKRKRISFLRKQRPVKDGKITNDELEELAGKLGSSWDALGRRLEFTNAEITGFHKDNEEYANKPLKMLFKWREKEGSDATYRVLYNALCHRLVQRADLAEQFCCK